MCNNSAALYTRVARHASTVITATTYVLYRVKVFSNKIVNILFYTIINSNKTILTEFRVFRDDKLIIDKVKVDFD